MGHQHNHTSDSSVTRLVWAGVLNIAIAVVEFVGGLFSGSLSILSDALHNFTDAGAVGVSMVALKLNDKPKDLKHTFVLKKAQIFAAILNSAVLILISIFLHAREDPAEVHALDPQVERDANIQKSLRRIGAGGRGILHLHNAVILSDKTNGNKLRIDI